MGVILKREAVMVKKTSEKDFTEDDPVLAMIGLETLRFAKYIESHPELYQKEDGTWEVPIKFMEREDCWESEYD